MPTVIKAKETGPILKRLSTVDLADHLAEARAVVEEAKRRAEQIKADAKVQAGQVLEEARKAGYDSGYKCGHVDGTEAGHRAAHDESIQQFNQEHADIVADMGRVVAHIDSVKEDLAIAAEKDVLDFAVLLATKLTFEIGRSHHESVVENLERALRLVGSKTDLTIRVHSGDLAAMETFAASVLKQVDAARAVNIVADDSVGRGGCLVESDRTCVDATLETQVNEMVSLLVGKGARDA